MFYTEKIKIENAKELLGKCGLTEPKGVDCTIGVFRDDGKLVATGSLKGDMMQGIAVDPDHQGEDLMAKVLTALIAERQRIVELKAKKADDANAFFFESADVNGEAKGNYGKEQENFALESNSPKSSNSLYLFTKPDKVQQFVGLGMRHIATARPYVALLEWGSEGLKEYQDFIKGIANQNKEGIIAALVMNCNPFTKGHRYLVEKAAAEAQRVFLFVVQENASLFPFADRFEMVKRGTADIENVTVLPGGRYIISDMTFPSYFTKEENLAHAHAAMDAEIFAGCIAPVLNVNRRYVGTEPISEVTAIYNEELKKRLPRKGIEVLEIPRLESADTVISASRVRGLLKQYLTAENNGVVTNLQQTKPSSVVANSQQTETSNAAANIRQAGASCTAAKFKQTAENNGDDLLQELRKLLPATSFDYIMTERMSHIISERLKNY